MSERFTILKTNEEVSRRIDELAAAISADYCDITEENPLLLLCTLRGAVFFAADLIRKLTVPSEINFLKVHSYQGTRPAGSPIFDLGERIDVRGRYVLVVEDIVDTGQTMDTVIRNFSDKGAADIRICTMLDKPSRRYPQLKETVVPDYIGFEIPDLFVVGWGLDYDEKYRLLPDIMVYHPDAEEGKEQ
ncbi:MAG: hypoxanthine phosphoribosyltransferase [Oscillospiraceae bacterium]|nr:hypoxanthine phosphoribosyltransferase [Oscillospiraceae bacterium]